MPVIEPIMIKLLGLVFASMLVVSPITYTSSTKEISTPKIINEKSNIENAQNIADRSGKPVAVWINSHGQVNIQFANDKPLEPYNNLHRVLNPH